MANGNQSTGGVSVFSNVGGMNRTVPRSTSTTPEQNLNIIRRAEAELGRPLGATPAEAQARAGAAAPPLSAGSANLVGMFNQQGTASARPRPQASGGRMADSLRNRTSGGAAARAGIGIGGGGTLSPTQMQAMGIGRAAPGGAAARTAQLQRQMQDEALRSAQLQNQALQQQLALAPRQQQAAEQAQQADILSTLTRQQLAPQAQDFLGNLLGQGPTGFAQQTGQNFGAGQDTVLQALQGIGGLAANPLENPQLQEILSELERRFAEGQGRQIAQQSEAGGASSSALRSLLETEGRARLAGQQAQTILNAQLQAAGQLNPLASALSTLGTDPVFGQQFQLGQLAPTFQTQQSIGEVAPLPAFDFSQLALGTTPQAQTV